MTQVIGFHACPKVFAEALWTGSKSKQDWMESVNDYDWLGRGIYFWEDGLRRAKEWADELERRKKVEMSVIKARIELGRCLDLNNTSFREMIRLTFDSLEELHQEQPDLGLMPSNTGNKVPLRRRDCYVIDQFVQLTGNGIYADSGEIAVVEFQSVRCTFEEGDALFPGSGIRQQSHTQLAIRDRECIVEIYPSDFRDEPSEDAKLIEEYVAKMRDNKGRMIEERKRLTAKEIMPGVIIFE